MTVNAKISASDYNSIRDLAVKVMGNSSSGTNASFGYGQSVKSSAVAVGDTVKNSEWDLLRYDLVNILTHQIGSATVTQEYVNNIIKSDNDASVINGYLSGGNLYVTSVNSGMVSIGQTISGSGITAATITGTASFPATPLNFVNAKSGAVGGPYTVQFGISLLPYTPLVNSYYTVSGNYNPLYNGTFKCTAASTTSITLQYLGDPGTFGGGYTTFVPVLSPHGNSAWTISVPQSTGYVTLNAESPSDYPWQKYLNLMNTYSATPQRFALATGQRTTNSKQTTSYTSDWNQMLYCEGRVTFGSAQEARHFFNSGGLIRLRSTRSSGTGTTQDNNWSALLNSAGNVDFGAQSPSTGYTPSNGTNFYRLTSSYQTAYSITDSGSYSLNTYKIEAKCDVADNASGTATYIDFRITWTDSHYATGAGPDNVTGNLLLEMSEVKASGTLAPSGSFAITSPVYQLGSIGNNQTFQITAAASTVNEGSYVDFTITTTNVPDGTVLAWDTTELGGVSINDFTDSVMSGLVTINSNTASIRRTITTADLPVNGTNPGFNAYTAQSTEGTEYFRLNLRLGSTASTIVASSAYVGISDNYTNSMPTYVQFPNIFVGSTTDQGQFVNIWFRRSVIHYVITRDELRRLGWYAGVVINAIGWTLVKHPYKPGTANIVQPVIPLPSFQIGMCNTASAPATNLGGQLTAVSVQADYTMPQIPQWGGNQFIYWPLAVKFTWDGSSNLGLSFARGQVQDNYYGTGQQQMHNLYGISGVAGRSSVTDNAGTYSINDTTQDARNRPAFVFYRD